MALRALLLMVVTVQPAACVSANPLTHLFYYPWYGNPDTDGRWLHWDHKVVPHWTDSVNKHFPQDTTFLL